MPGRRRCDGAGRGARPRRGPRRRARPRRAGENGCAPSCTQMVPSARGPAWMPIASLRRTPSSACSSTRTTSSPVRSRSNTPHSPQVAQVVGGALPAEDGEPAQLVDLPVVAVGAGVGEHPAGGVLDADDAVGEQRDGLGEREQVVGPRGSRPRRARPRRATPGAPSARPAARRAARPRLRRPRPERGARVPPSPRRPARPAAARGPRRAGTASRPRAPTTRTRPPRCSSGSSSGSTMARPLIGTSRPAGAASTVTSGSPTAARSWRSVLMTSSYSDDSDRSTLADRTSPRRRVDGLPLPHVEVHVARRGPVAPGARDRRVGPVRPAREPLRGGCHRRRRPRRRPGADGRPARHGRPPRRGHHRAGPGRRQRRGLRAHPRAGWATRASPTGSRCR